MAVPSLVVTYKQLLQEEGLGVAWCSPQEAGRGERVSAGDSEERGVLRRMGGLRAARRGPAGGGRAGLVTLEASDASHWRERRLGGEGQ